MRIGVGSYTFPRNILAGTVDARSLLHLAVARGCNAVQFCENLSLLTLRGGELDDIVQTALANGITLEVGTRSIDEANLQVHIDLAERFGSGFVRLVADTPDSEPTAKEIVEFFKRVQPSLEAANVVLALENHDRFSWIEVKEMVSECGPWTRVCLDSANSLGAFEGLEALYGLAPVAINFHAKDIQVRRKPDMLGFEVIGVPCGTGQVPFAELLPLLDHCLSVTLEQWVPVGGESLDRELEWADLGLAFLKEAVPEAIALRERGFEPPTSD